MEINNKKLKKTLAVFGHPSTREILFSLNTRNAMTYSEIKKTLGFKATKSGLTAYYVNKMKNLQILAYDRATATYYLTKKGVHLLRVVNKFEEFCTEYTMADDVGEDGKVIKKVWVHRRS